MHYAELAVISGLRILKSLKEANSGDEMLYTHARHFTFEDKNSFWSSLISFSHDKVHKK